MILSDTEKNETSASALIFENDYLYVTQEGKLFLKKTDHFDEQLIASFDPESLEERLKKFRQAFTELEDKVDTFISDWKQKKIENPEEVEKSFEDFKKTVLSEKAAGDFGSLFSRLENALTEIREKGSDEHSDSEKQEGAGIEGTASESEEADEIASEEPLADPEKGKKEEAQASEESESEEIEDTISETGPDEQSVDDTDPEKYYSELAEKAEQLIEMTDWPYVTMEFSNLEILWSEGPDPSDADKEIDINEYRSRIDSARQVFEQKKAAHFEEQKKIKAENLEKKNALLQEFKKIIDEKNWTATKEVARIRNKWDQIKPLPSGAAEQLQENFNKLVREFDDHKVDRLVRKKQKEEENLVGKLVILDKMDGFLKNLDETVSDWPAIEESLEKLNKQWRKIGRVPVEKNQEIWDRYHDIQERFHQIRFKFDKKYRSRIEQFLSKKKQLIKEAELLIDDDNLASAARKVNKLHRRWKKVGNLPQKDENELWDQFKAATDAFNEKKSKNIDQLRDQEDENLEKKKGLIAEAEALKDSDDWEATHNQLQKLMKRWKEIGPVPKRKSGKIWKQFKGVMDHFYDRRREHYKEIKEDRKENLEEKQQILDKLKALTEYENPIKAVEEAKPLQEEFKKAGYVPIKFKNKMWKEYRETCDIIYDRFRAAKSAASVVGKENVSDYSADDIAEIQKKQKEAGRLRKEINKLHSEMIQMKESLSYFKPSGKSSNLLNEVHEKVEKIEDEIENKENRLADLEKEIDQLTRDS